MSAVKCMRKMGWLPDFPDFRDFTPEHGDLSEHARRFGESRPVRELVRKAGVGTQKKKAVPATADLRQWCPPVEQQGNIGSCTAQAGAGIVEYFERRAFGKHVDASRLFLYKATRNLLHYTGDTGAFLRTTLGALVLFGAPPEEYWPYVEADFEKEPTAFCYAFAQSYQALTYYRLDPPGTGKDAVLQAVKTHLANGLPPMFGFTVYTSIARAEADGCIPFPGRGDRVAGGHAVVAVGYDDSKVVAGGTGGQPTTGALLVRNSWGAEWGDQGYGWLPYEYLLRGLAEDWWCLIKGEWVDTGAFGQ